MLISFHISLTTVYQIYFCGRGNEISEKSPCVLHYNFLQGTMFSKIIFCWYSPAEFLFFYIKISFFKYFNLLLACFDLHLLYCNFMKKYKTFSLNPGKTIWEKSKFYLLHATEMIIETIKAKTIFDHLKYWSRQAKGLCWTISKK